MSRFNIINSGICPECEGTLVDETSGPETIHVCHYCGVHFYRDDDMGGTFYQRTVKEQGRYWRKNKIQKALDILNEIEIDDYRTNQLVTIIDELEGYMNYG